MNRDTKNAVALGIAVAQEVESDAKGGRSLAEVLAGALLAISWDLAIARIDEVAEMLDIEQGEGGQLVDFWQTYDWYLTIDRLAAELVRNPDLPWTAARVRMCLVER